MCQIQAFAVDISQLYVRQATHDICQSLQHIPVGARKLLLPKPQYGPTLTQVSAVDSPRNAAN
jgi:hypothetical protein